MSLSSGFKLCQVFLDRKCSVVVLLCSLLCVSFACERIPRNDSVAICCQYSTNLSLGIEM